MPAYGRLLLRGSRLDLAGATTLGAVVARLGGFNAARMRTGLAVGFGLRAAACYFVLGGGKHDASGEQRSDYSGDKRFRGFHYLVVGVG